MLRTREPKTLLNNKGEKGLHRVILTGGKGREGCSKSRDSHSSDQGPGPSEL